MQHNLKKHPGNNKLREVETLFVDNDYDFSFNKEIVYSFDVCGNCEAHAILLAMKLGIRSSVAVGNDTVNVHNAAVLYELPKRFIANLTQFTNCF